MKRATLQPYQLWFEYENYQKYLRYAQLSKNEKEIVGHFNKDGFYSYKNALNKDELFMLNSAIDQWVNKHESQLNINRKEDGTFPRLIALHDEIPAINELFINKIANTFQDLLFGHRNSLRTSITFLQGSQQALHRDIPIFNTFNKNFFFRIWFALEDATVDNGSLIGVKGAHKIALNKYDMHYKFYTTPLKHSELDPILWSKHQDALQIKYEKAGLQIENLELKKGDALIWHPLFPHGGTPIKNKMLTRRSIVLHFSAI